MPRNDGIAYGESMGRKSGGWDEADVGAAGNDAPVGVQGRYALHIDSICRTAVYVIRSYGGVGGGAVRLLSYPEWALGRTIKSWLLIPSVSDCFHATRSH